MIKVWKKETSGSRLILRSEEIPMVVQIYVRRLLVGKCKFWM